MNQECALAKTVMPELLCGAWSMKKMAVERKEVNSPSHSWYGVTCHLKDNGDDNHYFNNQWTSAHRNSG